MTGTQTVEDWPEILGVEVRDGYVIRNDGVAVLLDVPRQDGTGKRKMILREGAKLDTIPVYE